MHSPTTTTKRRLRRPLHHATRGPPPPLSRVRMHTIVLATHPRPSPDGTISKILRRSSIASRLDRRWGRSSAQSSATRSPDGAKRNPGSLDASIFAPGFHSVSSGLRNNEPTKGKRNAGRRVVQLPHQRMRLPPPNLPRHTGGTEGGSPSGVPPRHLRQRPNATAQLQLTRFLGRISLGAGVIRSLPSQCSGFPHRPVLVPAGRVNPEPPGNGGDEPPPAGTALAPPAGAAG
jgi:hypothetical protein